MMTLGYLLSSPLGSIALRADDDALTGFFFVDQKYFPSLQLIGEQHEDVPRVIAQAREQLREFFAGERRVFDLPLRLNGTAFQVRVWEELSRIPYGEVVSYGNMAKNMGLSGGHSRAVGTANGRNPISIIVPCHRVIGGSGDLTGYAGGLDRKRALLAVESAAIMPQLF